jgi:hypothetical protein
MIPRNPEFVQSYPKPLNPDAFSRFIPQCEESKADNADVREATK